MINKILQNDECKRLTLQYGLGSILNFEWIEKGFHSPFNKP